MSLRIIRVYLIRISHKLERFSNNAFPVTLRLLRSMAHTATMGVNSPLMAMGMLMVLYIKENIRF